MKLRDIMTENPAVVNPDTSVEEAALIMKEKNVGSIPVCEEKRPVGIVTDRDITLRNVSEGHDSNENVGSIMSKRMIYGTPEMDIQEAIRLMSENRIRRLPVVDNNELVGIVSLGDLAVDPLYEEEAAEALSKISQPSRPLM